MAHTRQPFQFQPLPEEPDFVVAARDALPQQARVTTAQLRGSLRGRGRASMQTSERGRGRSAGQASDMSRGRGSASVQASERGKGRGAAQASERGRGRKKKTMAVIQHHSLQEEGVLRRGKSKEKKVAYITCWLAMRKLKQ